MSDLVTVIIPVYKNIIFLKDSLKSVVDPAPGSTTSEIAVVTPYPITIPAALGLVVAMPIVWSAALSMKQTFIVFAQVPGFLAP